MRHVIRAVQSLIASAVMLLFVGYMFLQYVMIPVLLQPFGEDSTALVIDCQPGRIKGGNGGHLPTLTYMYLWNGQMLRGTQGLEKTYDAQACQRYLNHMLPVRVLVPNPATSRLVLSEATRPDGVIMACVFLFAVMSVLYRSLRTLRKRLLGI